MSLKAHGVTAFADLIEQNINQAHYLSELIAKEPELELLAPVNLNVVCFRYKGIALGNSTHNPDSGATSGHESAAEFTDSTIELNKVNQELLLRIQESGVAVPSGTTINGHYALRVAIVNHRSKFSDFEKLVQSTLQIGRQLTS
jgi:aromatic-L-amino-acid decarboxylase